MTYVKYIERTRDYYLSQGYDQSYKWAHFDDVAFALLPTGWVALGLAAWGALAFPGVVEIHRQFQNVPNGEPDPV